MKKLAIALVLAMILAIVVVGPAMADGPGKDGQGGDPSVGDHPPNDVWVPLKAFEARGPNPPGQGTDGNNGAVFHGPPGG